VCAEFESMTARRLASIDKLRGTAVLAVVISHLPFSNVLSPSAPDAAGAHSALPRAVTDITDFGSYGVHLFLVISGFCIHLPAARGQALGVGAFWFRRMRRLYPPYLAAVMFSVAGLFAYHGLIRGQLYSVHGALGFPTLERLTVDLGSLLLQFQNITGAGARIGNSPLWTLALEEQLYVLYFALLALRARFGWPVTLVVVLSVTLLSRASVLVGAPSFVLDLGPARWIEWTLGALAAEAYASTSRVVPRWLSSPWALATAVAVLVMTLTLSRAAAKLGGDAAAGIVFFVIVHMFTQGEQSWSRERSCRWLTRLGLISYSIYLTHSPALFAAKQIGLRLGWDVGPMLGLRLLVVMLTGWVFYKAVEQHFLVRQQPVHSDAVEPAACR
jgi:peptidoglycan/LPS O-acetylase OafA/YrhL